MAMKPVAGLLAGAAALVSAPSMAVTCTDLVQLASDTVAITAAEHRGDATLEQRFGPAQSLAPHCRIAAVLTPRAESRIEMEVWMPDDWNGKFLALGNGGWAGSISFSAMASGLAAGYAVASNDTGHTGGSAAFAVGNREKVVDFAWRATHEMTSIAKAVIETFYERAPSRSYFQGCSTGGRQGMMEAQLFPGDFGPSPLNTINYYNDVLATTGPDQDDWMRLFLVPGMGHCAGGIGSDQADFLGAIDAWVEEGRPPDRITASRVREGEVDMTRPLCPYPAVATWDGTGDPNDADRFSCR